MSKETVLCYSPGACSLAPHVVLREIGQQFELRRFAIAEGANRSSEYLNINPRGLIPTLQIDGFALTENPAILAYLGRRYPDAGLYPSNVAEGEANCLRWLAWSSNTVHVAYAQILRPERFVSREEDYTPVTENGRKNFERLLGEVDAHLRANTYALGDRYSVVDPFWLVFYRWGNRQGHDMRSLFPSYTRFAQSLLDRPAVKTALEVEEISIWA